MTRTAPEHDDATRPGLRIMRAARINPRRRLLVLVALSLLLHAALGWVSFDQPMGFVAPEKVADRQTVMRVRRASYEYASDPSARGSQSPAAEPATPSAAEVSRALLNQGSAAEPEPPENNAPDPDPVGDRRVVRPDTPAAVTPPDLNAQEQFFQSLASRSPKELPIGPENGEADGSGEAGASGRGEGDGAGGSAGSGGSGGQARDLLARAGAMPGANPEPPAPTPRPLKDRARADQGLLEAPSAANAVDLAESALAQTRQLKMPRHLDNDFNYYLSRYDPPRADRAGYFRVDVAARQSLSKLSAMQKDLIFLVDTSDSISRAWVRQTVRGLSQSLPSLNQGDRFNLVMFNDQPRFFSTHGVVPANPRTIQQARAFLEGADSEGYTDVNAALRQLLVRKVDPGRVRQIVLLSDGKATRGVMNTRSLINLVTRDNNRVASIYCIGVGREQNRELLDFLAYRNNGFSRFIADRDQAARRIRSMMSRLRYPLIKNVQVHVAGVTQDRVFPKRLPNIHDGQTLAVFGRYEKPGSFTMRITGVNSGRPVDFTFTRDLSLASTDDQQIARDWAFWKLHHLYSEILRRGRSTSLQQQIDQLQQRYDLPTVY